ncbi:MAG: hypothetical protein HY078_06015 [Elusimicrobia bacterium]|nr:hypothetical protein [Elusimicrobiota bacterium]
MMDNATSSWTSNKQYAIGLACLGVALTGVALLSLRSNRADGDDLRASMPRPPSLFSDGARAQARSLDARASKTPAVRSMIDPPAPVSKPAGSVEPHAAPQAQETAATTDPDMARGEALGETDGAGPKAYARDGGGGVSLQPAALGGSTTMRGSAAGAAAAKPADAKAEGKPQTSVFPAKAQTVSALPKRPKSGSSRRPEFSTLIMHSQMTTGSKATSGISMAPGTASTTSTGADGASIVATRHVTDADCGLNCRDRTVSELSRPPSVGNSVPVNPPSSRNQGGGGSAPSCGGEKSACSPEGSAMPCCQGFSCTGAYDGSADLPPTKRGGFNGGALLYTCTKTVQNATGRFTEKDLGH